MGQGGVGSYAAEFLVRAGVGKITIMDGNSRALCDGGGRELAVQQDVGLRFEGPCVWSK